jgi:hypothetical protein
MGVRNRRGVIVRPDLLNPVSFDQICVRGRFHYDAVPDRDRLSRHMIRRGEALLPASWEEALDSAAERLAEISRQHGPGAIGFLGSPIATNEENYLLQKLARAVVGTNNVDFSSGPVAAAVANALRDAFGSEALPADLSGVAQASALVVVADDLESSHNVAALRVKDAVVQRGARLVVVSPRYGEVCDFAEVWVRPRPGGEAAALAAIAGAVAANTGTPDGVEAPAPTLGGEPSRNHPQAADLWLRHCRARGSPGIRVRAGAHRQVRRRPDGARGRQPGHPLPAAPRRRPPAKPATRSTRCPPRPTSTAPATWAWRPTSCPASGRWTTPPPATPCARPGAPRCPRRPGSTSGG